MKILFISTEISSTILDKNSLLSIGLVVWEDGLIRGSKDIKIRHNNYNVDVSVYSKDILEHDKNGLDQHLAMMEFTKFLSNNFQGQQVVMLGGLEMHYDILYLKEFLGVETFEKWFGTLTMDISQILQYLFLCKKLDDNIFEKDLFQYFDITTGNTVLDDCIANAKLFTKLINMVKEK